MPWEILKKDSGSKEYFLLLENVKKASDMKAFLATLINS